MKRFLSHPTLFLGDHISQVQRAMEAVIERHQPGKWSERNDIPDIYSLIASLHDSGKASTQFQRYIKDPGGYRGDRLAKAHTPLSLILTVFLAAKKKWAPLLSLALAQVVRGHHSELASRRELDLTLYSDHIAGVLERQILDLDLKKLGEEIVLDFRGISLEGRPWIEASDFIDECWEELDLLPVDEAIRYRLWVQWLFSVLLEADKAFLAVKDPTRYLEHKLIHFPVSLVDDFIDRQKDAPINKLRQEARLGVLSSLRSNLEARISTITLPTGLGKTATAASWALALREQMARAGLQPRIIVVLPYLSIIDQTEAVYRSILHLGKDRGDVLLPCHSLADRTYDPEMDGDTADFFVDTWRSEVVVTTFDQFLMALMDGKARHQMRFHNLCDSLIIMDEIQTLPCKLWDPLDKIFGAMVEKANSRMLAMSATMPGFLSDAVELVPDYKDYFRSFGRYRLILKHRETETLDDFAESICERSSEWLRKGKRVLLTLNTRKSAREVRDSLEKAGARPLFFLSADVTPRDRLQAIGEIRKNEPCIVVSTQCIEAGVDIDLDLVIRDFAPLDSIIQVAGRCNRNFGKDRCDVEVVTLINKQGRPFCEIMGYNGVHLQETRKALAGVEEVLEEDVLDICTQYFAALAEKKDLGIELTKSFAKWEDMPPVRELLRGKNQDQYHFVVIERDFELRGILETALSIQDRWERRRALRSLAGRIAQITISVYARSGLMPDDIAEQMGPLWLLQEGFYSSERGLDLPASSSMGTVIL